MGEGSHIYGTARRRTEQGYTPKMLRNIVGLENRIRRNRDESLHFFDSKGNQLHSNQGEGAGVLDDGYKPPANSILTHNHPRALGKKGLESIGNSFSWQDIRTAIVHNAKEMRAVPPTYTFSLKRPKGGWGVDALDFLDSYLAKNKELESKNWDYINNYKGDKTTAARRADATHFHDVATAMSKKYGWKYTKTKG